MKLITSINMYLLKSSICSKMKFFSMIWYLVYRSKANISINKTFLEIRIYYNKITIKSIRFFNIED